jgi:hypothetical protein
MRGGVAQGRSDDGKNGRKSQKAIMSFYQKMGVLSRDASEDQ